MTDKPRPLLSIVIPVKNEEESIPSLAQEIEQAFKNVDYTWNVVWIDDGSNDKTLSVLKGLGQQHRWISLEHNVGQSAAFMAGVKATDSDWIASLDGDGQNDPGDLTRQLDKALFENYDMVNGIRQKRNDSAVRRLSSKIANATRNKLTGKSVTDVGCSTRVVKRTALLELPFFHGMHRFLPTLIKLYGYRIAEIPVNHRQRLQGKSKYGINNRLWSGLRDLFGVRWLIKRYRHVHIAERSDN